MKMTLTILLLGLFFCDCSKSLAVESPAVALNQGGTNTLIQPGTDVRLKGYGMSYIIHVAKRNGSSIQGIRLVSKKEGEEITYTADTGTVSESSDGNSVTITLFNAKFQGENMHGTYVQLGP